jgi:integrase
MCPRSIKETMMTPLRQRMLDTLQLRGLSQCTCESYIRSVARLARHYRRSPDALSADDVQQYPLHLLRNRKLARTTVTQYGCAYRFLYGTVPGLDGGAFQIPLGAAPQQLPELLSREEIARLFAVACHAQSRTFLMIAYGTGLRVSELCRLRVQDIDSHADRMCIRVVQGKGSKDRYVPSSEGVLEILRRWWQLARPREWLFVGEAGSDRPLAAQNPALVKRRLCPGRYHQARRHLRASPCLRHAPAGGRC